MSEDEELDRDTSRKFDSKWSIREVMDTFNSRLYYKVTISSGKECDLSGSW